MPNILINHGCGNHNLGDIAQLQAVINYHSRLPDNSVSITPTPCNEDFNLAATQVWTNPFRINRFDREWLSNKPYVWRLGRLIDKVPTSTLVIGAVTKNKHYSCGAKKGALRDFVSQFDVLHLPGGGYLTDTFVGHLYEKCCLIEAFAEQQKPVILTGQQIGPFKSGLAKRLVYKAVRKATFVGLREPGNSSKHAQRSGLTPNKIAITGDDSLGFEAESPAALELLKEFQLAPQEFLAVNFRLASYASTGEEDLKKFASFIRQCATRHKKKLVYLPISKAGGDNDVTTGEKLRELISDQTIILAPPSLSAGAAKSLLSHAHAAIGTSYHFCTFATSTGTRAMPVVSGNYYMQKADGMRQFWGSELVQPISIQALGSADTVSSTDSFLTKPIPTYAYNNGKVRQWREKLDRAFSNLQHH